MMTFAELLDKLKQEDEVTLLELLDMTSSDLVDNLEDCIYEKQQVFRDYFDEAAENVGE